MQSVYAKFSHGEPDYHSQATAAIFDPELTALEHRHEAQIDAGQADQDDIDLLCGCQDTSHPTWKITTVQQAPDRALSNVVFKDQGSTLKLVFALRFTAAGWRIADFMDVTKAAKPNWSQGFKASLVDEIRQAATRKRESH